jgi:uncharacterized protein YheU (UPF0270 family)
MPGVKGETAGAVEVPWEGLSADALEGLIEEFVTRDGTDYGTSERSLASKKAEIRRLLERGEVRIVFDPESGSANIIGRDEFRRRP